ncbi:MAG: FtsK/SpoIIIE domain-containing protein [Tractidigestivibacter sp.]|jgi:hypothetical protein|uniref:FtsK/SpoIIIE domain-containing protein n=1 Tax=Tractidigestivibacter sp. TaxID=2847320 RepID=UPI003D94F2B0
MGKGGSRQKPNDVDVDSLLKKYGIKKPVAPTTDEGTKQDSQPTNKDAASSGSIPTRKVLTWTEYHDVVMDYVRRLGELRQSYVQSSDYFVKARAHAKSQNTANRNVVLSNLEKREKKKQGQILRAVETKTRGTFSQALMEKLKESLAAFSTEAHCSQVDDVDGLACLLVATISYKSWGPVFQKATELCPEVFSAKEKQLKLPVGIFFQDGAFAINVSGGLPKKGVDIVTATVVSAVARLGSKGLRICVVQPEAPKDGASTAILNSLSQLRQAAPTMFIWGKQGDEGARAALTQTKGYLNSGKGRAIVVAFGLDAGGSAKTRAAIKELSSRSKQKDCLLLAPIVGKTDVLNGAVASCWEISAGPTPSWDRASLSYECMFASQGTLLAAMSRCQSRLELSGGKGRVLPQAIIDFVSQEPEGDPDSPEAVARFRSCVDGAVSLARTGDFLPANEFSGKVCLADAFLPLYDFESQPSFDTLKLAFNRKDGKHQDRIGIPLEADLRRPQNFLVTYKQGSQESALSFVQELTWQFIRQIPPTLLHVKVVDVRQGGSCAGMLLLNGKTQTLFNSGSATDNVTKPRDFDTMVSEVRDQVDDVIRDRTRAEGCLVDYNLEHPENAMPLTLVVVNGAEDLLRPGDPLYANFCNLMSRGYQGGVYVVMSAEEHYAFDHATQLDELSAATFLVDENGVSLSPSGLSVLPLETPALPQSDADANAYLSAYRDEAKRRAAKGLDFSAIAGDTLFDRSSLDGLDIPIGIGENGQQIEIHLNKDVPHGIICGNTGSGKSTLLHTMILSAISHYSPDELQLYLLDFKQGNEFGPVYANPAYPLPHMRLVAVSALPEFGESVLKELCDEMDRRSLLFNQLADSKVNALSAYRRETRRKMPRILVVIDEAEVLFKMSANDEVAKNCNRYLGMLAKQGRSYGIHLVLSSQNFISSPGVADAISQMAVRIGLKNSEDNQAQLFGVSKKYDALKAFGTDSAKGVAVMTNDVHSSMAPFRFRVSFCNPENGDRDRVLEKISKESKQRGFEYTSDKNRVFNVSEPCKLSDVADAVLSSAHKQRLDAIGQVVVPLGEPIRMADDIAIKFDSGMDSNMLAMVDRRESDFALTELLADAVLFNRKANMLYVDLPAFTGNETDSDAQALSTLEGVSCGRVRVTRNEAEALAGIHCVFDEYQRRLAVMDEGGIASLGDIIIVFRRAAKRGFFERLVGGKVTKPGARVSREKPDAGVGGAGAEDASANDEGGYKGDPHTFDFFGDVADKLDDLLAPSGDDSAQDVGEVGGEADSLAGEPGESGEPEALVLDKLPEDPYALEWEGELSEGAPGASKQLAELVHEGSQCRVFVVITAQSASAEFYSFLDERNMAGDLTQRVVRGLSAFDGRRVLGSEVPTDSMNANVVYFKGRNAADLSVSCQIKPYLPLSEEELLSWRKRTEVPTAADAQDAPRFNRVRVAAVASGRAVPEAKKDEAAIADAGAPIEREHHSIFDSDLFNDPAGLFSTKSYEVDNELEDEFSPENVAAAAATELAPQAQANFVPAQPTAAPAPVVAPAQVPPAAGFVVELGELQGGAGAARLSVGPRDLAAVAACGGTSEARGSLCSSLEEKIEQELGAKPQVVEVDATSDALAAAYSGLVERQEAFASSEAYDYWDLRDRLDDGEEMPEFEVLVLKGALDAVQSDDEILKQVVAILRGAGAAGCLAILTGSSSVLQVPAGASLMRWVRRVVNLDIAQFSGNGLFFEDFSTKPGEPVLFRL